MAITEQLILPSGNTVRISFESFSDCHNGAFPTGDDRLFIADFMSWRASPTLLPKAVEDPDFREVDEPEPPPKTVFRGACTICKNGPTHYVPAIVAGYNISTKCNLCGSEYRYEEVPYETFLAETKRDSKLDVPLPYKPEQYKEDLQILEYLSRQVKPVDREHVINQVIATGGWTEDVVRRAMNRLIDHRFARLFDWGREVGLETKEKTNV